MPRMGVDLCCPELRLSPEAKKYRYVTVPRSKGLNLSEAPTYHWNGSGHDGGLWIGLKSEWADEGRRTAQSLEQPVENKARGIVILSPGVAPAWCEEKTALPILVAPKPVRRGAEVRTPAAQIRTSRYEDPVHGRRGAPVGGYGTSTAGERSPPAGRVGQDSAAGSSVRFSVADGEGGGGGKGVAMGIAGRDNIIHRFAIGESLASSEERVTSLASSRRISRPGSGGRRLGGELMGPPGVSIDEEPTNLKEGRGKRLRKGAERARVRQVKRREARRGGMYEFRRKGVYKKPAGDERDSVWVIRVEGVRVRSNLYMMSRYRPVDLKGAPAFKPATKGWLVESMPFPRDNVYDQILAGLRG
ncbi:hypothetical protein C8R44DRAFT_743775 [Mycena epipterygia]|nr:hypothetical protein C8R44DRAFT_743775 [Mycena epipterygia]